MSMRRACLVGGLLAGLASAACFLVFNATPATVDAQGVLHEPFGLVPLGYLFALLAVLSFGVAWLRRQ
jgi:cell division protein FtsX